MFLFTIQRRFFWGGGHSLLDVCSTFDDVTVFNRLQNSTQSTREVALAVSEMHNDTDHSA